MFLALASEGKFPLLCDVLISIYNFGEFFLQPCKNGTLLRRRKGHSERRDHLFTWRTYVRASKSLCANAILACVTLQTVFGPREIKIANDLFCLCCFFVFCFVFSINVSFCLCCFCFLLLCFALFCFVLAFCRVKNSETIMLNSAASAWLSQAAWRDLFSKLQKWREMAMSWRKCAYTQ